MNQQVLIATCFSVAMAFTACNKDEHMENKKNFLDVSVTAISNPKTRSGITESRFSEGETLGVFIYGSELGTPYTASDNTSEHLVTKNVPYIATGGINFTASTPIRLGSATGTVYAYYPYNEEIGEGGIGEDIPIYVAALQGDGLNDGTADVAEQFDYMHATPVPGRSNATLETANADLMMHHVLTMVSFKFINKNTTYPGNGIVNKITLRNKPGSEALKSGDGTMDISSGDVIFSDVAQEGITLVPAKALLDKEGEISYPKMLIPPTTFQTGDAEIIFIIDDASYTVALPAMEMERGTRYEFPVNLSGTELTIGTVTIMDWVTDTQDDTEIKTPDK